MDTENIFYINNMPDTTILIMHLHHLLDLSQYFMMNSFTDMKMKDILLTMRWDKIEINV